MFLPDTDRSERNFHEEFVTDVGIPEYSMESLMDKKIIILDDIRITPAVMVFEDAFEGRKFKQKLVIQNCGKNAAFIRICPPTSYAFKITTFVRGQYLSPGLSIVRNISYTYMRASAVRMASFPIHVNDHCLHYQMLVTLSSSVITANPQHLDFGTVDAGHTTATRTLLLKNSGTKAARFAIDLGSNKLDLIVRPMKGIIQPKCEVTLRLEIMRSTQGNFLQEFWIKCDPPIRIQITINFIQPKLDILNADTCSDFTMLDFKRAYYGTYITKFLVIKNESSTDSMFCVMADVQKRDMLFQEAGNVDRDFTCFTISQLDGRLKPFEGRILQVIFSPKKFPKTNDPDSHQDYAICSINIIHVGSKDLQDTPIDFKDVGVQNVVDILSKTYDISTTSISLSFDEDENYPSLEYIQYEIESLTIPLKQKLSQKVLLHGMFETASVNVRPDSFHLIDMKINEKENRELHIINCSANLPIIFSYRKIANIEVEPKYVFLGPSQAVEVNVVITPTKIGQTETTIVFDLLYPNLPRESKNDYAVVGRVCVQIYFNVPTITTLPKIKFNMGITPQITNEVGILTDDVKFSTSIEKPRAAMVNKKKRRFRNDNSLIAFPNDRPKSTRPWRKSAKCKTIFAGIPRTVAEKDEYELTSSRQKLRKAILSFYQEYVKAEGVRLRPCSHKKNLEYEITDTKRVLLQDIKFTKKCYYKKLVQKENNPSFIPLTPTQLYKIKILPLHIDLGRIAARSRAIEVITLKNENDFSIRVIMKARQPSVIFPDGSRTVISESEEVQIKIDYIANEVGNYHLNVDVIINECHFYEITINVDVVLKSVKLSEEEIKFIPSETNNKFIEISNVLNVPVIFFWDVPTSSFSIQPLSACVNPKRNITCLITYKPGVEGPITTEFTLMTECGSNQPLKVFVEVQKPLVAFQTYQYMIEHIPLNLPLTCKLFLRNFGFEDVPFIVLKPEPIPGVKIQPDKGVLKGKADLIFTIYLCLKACIDFDFPVEVQVQMNYTTEFHLFGHVDYPLITIEPKILTFRKIVAFAYDCLVFFIQNKSDSCSSVRFELEDFPDYIVSEHPDSFETETLTNEIMLNPHGYKQLFLYFNPIDVACYNFYLPIVINNIFGPPIVNDTNSMSPHSYLHKEVKLYANVSNACVIEMPSTLPLIQVYGPVSGLLLKFSTYNLDFKYFPDPNYKSVTQNEITICNINNELVEFCIRLDDLDKPFSLKYVSGCEIEINEKSFVCRMKPMEEVVFKATFLPLDAGNYFVSIPIYIRRYHEGSPFNYLKLSGIYPEPTLDTTDNYYFEPVPLNCKSEMMISLNASYHLPGCTVQYKTDILEAIITFPMGQGVNTKLLKSEFLISIIHFTASNKVFDSTVTFSCSCGAICEISVKGVSENCALTTHAFLKNKFITFESQFFTSQATSITLMPGSTEPSILTNESGTVDYSITNVNETCFPLFPDDTDTSDFANYMRKTVHVLENWIYEQVFSKKKFYQIPEGISAYPKEIEKETMNKKNRNAKPKEVTLIFLQILTNLAGPSIKNLVIRRSAPEENLDRVAYVYSIYMNIMYLMKEEDAFLPHVDPKHLLEYEDYLTYMKYIYPQTENQQDDTKQSILDEHTYNRISKQSWLDVLLQTYKLFVLARVRISSKKKTLSKLNVIKTSMSNTHLVSSKCTLKSSASQMFLKAVESTIFQNQTVHNKSETILLYWLEYNFEKQRTVLWETEVLQRHVQCFDNDLVDGLVLAATTANYCPYLAPYLKDFYLKPTTYEQLFHNASQLIKAWNKIRCSFSLIPTDIVKPNLVQMIFLVNYLYEILPALEPNETITFEVILSNSMEKAVTIENKSHIPLNYEVLLFGNEPQLFSVSQPLFKVPPKKEASLVVLFHAKKLKRLKSTLVLCGDIKGQHYSKAMAFNLEGIPDISTFNEEISFPGPLYSVFERSFYLHSPYLKETTYDIHFVNDRQIHIDNLHHVPWKAIKQHKLPRRMYNKRITQHCDDNGLSICNTVLCPLVPFPKEIYSYLISPDVGDFSLKINLDGSKRDERIYEAINVTLPRGFHKQICDCKKSQPGEIVFPERCPKRILLNIPYRNNLMWDCVEKMILKSIDDLDIPFWEKYLGTDTGLHIMQFILINERYLASRDVIHIFRKNVTYNIFPLKSPPPAAILQKTITFEETLEDGTLSIPAHVNVNGQPEDFFFNLVSEDGKEVRYYKVFFSESR